MDENSEKKINKEAQIIITIITIDICKGIIALGIIPFLVFAIYTYIMAGFPATKISRLIIHLGNVVKSKVLKIIYYALGLPCFLVLISIGACKIINEIYPRFFVKPDIYGRYIGAPFITLYLWILAIIAICFPYLKTLMVFLLKKISFRSNLQKN